MLPMCRSSLLWVSHLYSAGCRWCDFLFFQKIHGGARLAEIRCRRLPAGSLVDRSSRLADVGCNTLVICVFFKQQVRGHARLEHSGRGLSNSTGRENWVLTVRNATRIRRAISNDLLEVLPKVCQIFTAKRLDWGMSLSTPPAAPDPRPHPSSCLSLPLP
ncbi:hypothetical protein K461DRAFT_92142 [Myriangium duriaei CBS 260.36]|uniref:Uncharacterized protein n=1 Tax=Myriangium duriaei CBS 260.36 TaxID=1168546 RepID=A0A9P4JC87_9PEZI|nr:hypothetical protein K461DRAFT_92142 [Myriangium duriaei CBS 260.36]